MITELTQEQVDAMPSFVSKWIDKVSTPMNHDTAIAAVKGVYKSLKLPEPTVVIGQSPYHCCQMAVAVKEKKMSIDKPLGRAELDGLGLKLSIVTGEWYLSIFWATWCGWYDYAKYVGVKFTPEADYDLFIAFNSEVNFILPYDTVAFISEKPKVYWVDKKLHRDMAPAVEYPDGYSAYYLDGVRLPKAVVMTPAEKMDKEFLMQHFIKEPNVDVRARILKKIGVEVFAYRMGSKVIDSEPPMYDLLSLDLGGGTKTSKFLKMKNPSVEGLWHIEPVPAECNTVGEALHMRKPPVLRAIPVSEDGEDWQQQGDVCIWPKDAKSVKPRPFLLT